MAPGKVVFVGKTVVDVRGRIDPVSVYLQQVKPGWKGAVRMREQKSIEQRTRKVWLPAGKI